MQKVLRRTILAERQVARRKAKELGKLTSQQAKQARQNVFYTNREVDGQIHQAQKARREDYELGPLAPRRDVGDLKEKYGTISSYRIKAEELKGQALQRALEPFGGQHLNIVAGDRVVIIDGMDRGKIGKIREVDKSAAHCTIQGLNMADVAIPKYMITPEDPDQRPVRAIEQPVPLASVRLVYPLTNSEGVTRDVIVKKVVNSKIWFDRRTGAHSWTRVIPGLNIAIPWPKKDPVEHKDTASDTLRMEVEERTFVPTLLHPPMPVSVIDELRHKFSRFRTRHDPEYVAAKMEEDRLAKEKQEMSKKMRTPLNEANRKARKDRKKLGKSVLTEEMLSNIGRVMAQNQQAVMQSSGMIFDEPLTSPPEAHAV